MGAHDWTETGRYDFIAEAMWAGPMEMREKLLLLLDGTSLEVPFETDTNFSTLRSEKALWSLLYFAGYLTGTKSNSSLLARIPNAEITNELRTIWDHIFESENVSQESDSLVKAILTGDEVEFVSNVMPIAQLHHDTARNPETFYHDVLLHVLFSQHGKGYRLRSNKEHGLGRADLVLEPVSPGEKPAVILELKSSSKSSLERDAAKALAQIREKRYYETLPPGTTRALLWGIAFSGSEVFVKSTSLPLRANISEE